MNKIYFILRLVLITDVFMNTLQISKYYKQGAYGKANYVKLDLILDVLLLILSYLF